MDDIIVGTAAYLQPHNHNHEDISKHVRAIVAITSSLLPFEIHRDIVSDIAIDERMASHFSCPRSSHFVRNRYEESSLLISNMSIMACVMCLGLEENDLIRAGVLRASNVVILADTTEAHDFRGDVAAVAVTNEALVDSDAIFTYQVRRVCVCGL